ncbi:MAG: type II toxin-antitoxin system VapC family toxin [Oceanibaculum sp.]
MLLLDTHAAIWLMDADPKLGSRAKKAIGDAIAKNEAVVSAITFWEAALLVSKQRLTISRPLPLWRERILEMNIAELPMTGEIGILSVQLADLHGDPADRLIAATCLVHNATLLTADRRLLDWKGGLQMQDARQ